MISQSKLIAVAIVLLGGPLLAVNAVGAEQRTISVVGEGRASAVPDRARLSVGVTTHSARVREATQINRSSMQKMLVAMADLGIEDRALATSNYSIHYERPHSKSAEGTGIYRVSNMLRVELADLEKVDVVLDEVVRAGANQIWGVEMVLANVEVLEAEARAKAVANARAKAEELARLHGRKLGEVLRIAEEGAGRPQLRMMALEAGGGVIKPGEQSATVMLEVVYELR